MPREEWHALAWVSRSPVGTLTREIMPDLLHLSEKGYTIWAESIEPSLKKLMGEK